MYIHTHREREREREREKWNISTTGRSSASFCCLPYKHEEDPLTFVVRTTRLFIDSEYRWGSPVIMFLLLLVVAFGLAGVAEPYQTVYISRHCARSTPMQIYGGIDDFPFLSNFSNASFPPWGEPAYDCKYNCWRCPPCWCDGRVRCCEFKFSFAN